jgi:hypothetical protein
MYQAGVKKILLYENTGISFTHYDPLDFYAITNLQTTASIITILNEQLPEFDIDLKLLDSGEMGYDYSLKFYMLGLTRASLNDIIQLTTSIYGWCFLVEFYDGTSKYYDCPVFCDKNKIKPHKEMSFEITMKSAVLATKSHYEYLASGGTIPSVPVYRADTTLLRADTSIYTADYEL